MKREQICPRCGRTFKAVASYQIFCSKLCRDHWNTLDEDRRVDLRIPENRKRLEGLECKSPEWHAELQRMRFEQASGIKRQALVMETEPKTGDLKRTEKGAIWYPVSGREIQRIARETHRTYGEVCAEFLSKQVRVGGGA